MQEKRRSYPNSLVSYQAIAAQAQQPEVGVAQGKVLDLRQESLQQAAMLDYIDTSVDSSSYDTTSGVIQRLTKDDPPTKDKGAHSEKGGKAGHIERQVVSTGQDGGVPSVDPIGWPWLYKNVSKVKGNWVRFHMVNQYLGGPGHKTWNLVPTTNATNQDSDWRGLEEAAKGKNRKGVPVFYDVEAYYTDSSAYPAGFPSRITGEYHYYSGGDWHKGDESVDMTISGPKAGTGGSMTVYPHELTAKYWQLGIGVKSRGIAEWMGSQRKFFKGVSKSELIELVENKSYQFESSSVWTDEAVDQATKAIKSAASGKRTVNMSLQFES